MTEYGQTIKNLGCANGWGKTPKERQACRDAGHRVTERNIGRCYTEYTCTECGIRWTVDSSD